MSRLPAILTPHVLKAYRPGADPLAALRDALVAGWGVILKAKYDENLHPRDDRGRWVSKTELARAKKNPVKAAELRLRVTDPEQRKKLDKAIGDDPKKAPVAAPATGGDAGKIAPETAGKPDDGLKGYHHPDVVAARVHATHNAVEAVLASAHPDKPARVARLLAGHTRDELTLIRDRLGLAVPKGKKADVVNSMALRAAGVADPRQGFTGVLRHKSGKAVEWRDGKPVAVLDDHAGHARVSVDDAHARINELASAGELATEKGKAELADTLLHRMTTAEVAELKRRVGVKAGGNKAELVRKVVERLAESRRAKDAAGAAVAAKLWEGMDGPAKPKPAAKPPAKKKRFGQGDSLFDVVRSFGGIDPKSLDFLRHYESVGRAVEDGIAKGVFKKGGRGLDQLAMELHTWKHINVPEGMDQGEHLLEKLRDRAHSLHADKSAEHARAEADHYRALEEARKYAERTGDESGVATALRDGAESGAAEGGAGAGPTGGGVAGGDPRGGEGGEREESGDVGADFGDDSFDFGANAAPEPQADTSPASREYDFPASNTAGAFRARVEYTPDGKAVVTDADRGNHVLTVPAELHDRFVDELSGRISGTPGSGHPAVDAVLTGKGKFLGKGHEGQVFDAGNGEVVKAAVVTPFHWNNGLRSADDANKLLTDAAKSTNELVAAGVPGLLPQTVVSHGGRAFVVAPKVDTSAPLTAAHVAQLEETLAGMHAAGHHLADDVQFGVGPGGRATIFDTGSVRKLPAKNPHEEIAHDFDNLKRLAAKHGVPFVPPAQRGAAAEYDQAADEVYTNLGGMDKRAALRLRNRLNRLRGITKETDPGHHELTADQHADALEKLDGIISGKAGAAAPVDPAKDDHTHALNSIAPGSSGYVAGHFVRRLADGRHQIETPKGYHTGDAASVGDRIRRAWNDQKADGGAVSRALTRAALHADADPFTDPVAADAEGAKRAAVPHGARGVSLDPNTRGRVGSVHRDPDTGAAHLQLDGGRETRATDYEPLDPAHSWRGGGAATPKPVAPPQVTPPLFADAGAGAPRPAVSRSPEPDHYVSDGLPFRGRGELAEDKLDASHLPAIERRLDGIGEGIARLHARADREPDPFRAADHRQRAGELEGLRGKLEAAQGRLSPSPGAKDGGMKPPTSLRDLQASIGQAYHDLRKPSNPPPGATPPAPDLPDLAGLDDPGVPAPPPDPTPTPATAAPEPGPAAATPRAGWSIYHDRGDGELPVELANFPTAKDAGKSHEWYAGLALQPHGGINTVHRPGSGAAEARGDRGHRVFVGPAGLGRPKPAAEVAAEAFDRAARKLGYARNTLPKTMPDGSVAPVGTVWVGIDAATNEFTKLTDAEMRSRVAAAGGAATPPRVATARQVEAPAPATAPEATAAVPGPAEPVPTPPTAPETPPPATPRQAAAAHTAASAGDYAFARSSAVPNAGADLKGSARHLRNQWRGLEQAERDGTAEHLVTRDNLLKNEPHALLATISPHSALTHLAAHLAIQSFPTLPYSPDEYKQYAGQTRSGRKLGDTAPEKLREQYYEAYRAVKAEAERAAVEESDPKRVLARVQSVANGLVRKYRGQAGNTSIDIATAKDRFNPVANALVDLVKRTEVTRWGKPAATSAHGRLEDFARRAKEKYGDLSAANIGQVLQHAQDVVEGESFNKTFGTVKAGGRKFDAAEAYVKHATRKGGRVIDANTVAAGTDFLTKNLGLRGLQWGNSVSDDERQHHLTKSAEALADLADVTGLPDHAISLGGALGLAVGARGKGSAMAHYDPEGADGPVINLTRKKGVGSLAHEWGHALDHHVNGRKMKTVGRERHAEYLSESDRPREWTGAGWAEKDAEPVHAAMLAVRDTMKASGYDARLRKELQEALNRGEISGEMANYYLDKPEKFARVFERHVQHKLHGEGRENTYLSGVGSHPFWPTPEETAAIAPAMESLFAAVREKHFGGTAPAPSPSAVVYTRDHAGGTGADGKTYGPGERMPVAVPPTR